jgi:hypothetical protein
MSEQKYYVIGTTTEEAWNRVHAVLTADGTLEDNIPSRQIECTDLKEHSPTRAVYLMTDEEAAQLSNHPDIKFIEINVANYPETPRPAPEDLYNTPRYSANAKCYNNFVSTGLPNPATSAELNRSGYQLLRCNQYASPWYGVASTTVFDSTIPNTTNTGTNIDIIVGDDGCWFGHVEFNRSASWTSAYSPTDYVGGNKLPGSGTCDLLDVVLEGPYYIDPAWFNASPGTRLTTRWDGTTVPVEAVAREWWSNSSARSSTFASAGTVAIPSYYNRANCNGNNTTQSVDGTHGTACAGLAYGRTFGWAYNANKWFVNAYGNNGLWPIDNYFDVVKIFHQTKPVNPLFGTKDPTITSNSWGFRDTTPSTGYYYFRQGTTGTGGVAYSGTKPEFMRYIGSTGDAGRCKGEMLTNSLTTAGDELISAGVIFIAAAGNSNQKQVGSDQTDYNNYWSNSAATPLSSAVHDEFGSTCYNTTNRRGFPQQIGQYISGSNVVYPAINIGALDDNYQPDGKERKVNYSDMGEQIDCYTPADGTMSSNKNYSAYSRYDQITGYLTSTDCSFSGTSAACPVAAGLIATKLQSNRSWTWSDIRTWLQTVPLQQATTFYQGPDPSTAMSADWADLNSLMGGTRRVLYNLDSNTTGTLSGTYTMSGGLSFRIV